MVQRDRSRTSLKSILGRRRGISPPEVLVVLAVVFLMVMVLAFALPRRRETARIAGCRKNLMQIGFALALYNQIETNLPTVPQLGSDLAARGGPLKTLLETLDLPDLASLKNAKKVPPPRPDQVPRDGPVPGFVCPSDRAEGFFSPVSYRATTGETTEGTGGGFAPGHRCSLAQVESGDGLSFTAAFSERLLGSGRQDDRSQAGYALVKGPVDEQGCPASTALPSAGDAGSNWAEATWRSTLYNHAMTPGARGSCIAIDEKSARMGASSGHAPGVNVLIFDGGVRTVNTTIALPIWKALATLESHSPPLEPRPR